MIHDTLQGTVGNIKSLS